jgi:hypothetical protein
LTSQSTHPPEDDEDTIELELTAEEMLRLSQAANEAHVFAPDFAPVAPLPAKAPLRAGKRHYRLWPVTLAAALVGIATAIAWHPRPPHRAVQRIPPPPIARSTPPAVPQPAVPAEPPKPPVRVRNPFDAQEVFEFPPGITRAEARQRVADLLRERAIERGGLDAKSAHKSRAKNN